MYKNANPKHYSRRQINAICVLGVSFVLVGCDTMEQSSPGKPRGKTQSNSGQTTQRSPQGDAIRNDGIGKIAERAADGIFRPMAQGGRPDWGRIIPDAALGIIAVEMAATQADRAYAAKRAASYQRKTNARYLAVRTKSLSPSSNPTVVLVDAKSRQPVDGNKKYEIKGNEPSSGQELYISDYNVEYVR